MRLFGSVVHALLNPNQLKEDKTNKRFEPRTVIGFFVGHSRHQSGGVRVWVPGEKSYIYALTVKFDETRTYRSLQYPKSILSTDLPPLNSTHETNTYGRTITLPNPFTDNVPGTPNGNTLTPERPTCQTLGTQTAENDMPPKDRSTSTETIHSDTLPAPDQAAEDHVPQEPEPTSAELVRPNQPTRLPKGTRVSVFCDGIKYYPGTIIDQRPGPGYSLHHCISYDGWRKKYWHNFDEEDWKYENHHREATVGEPLTHIRGTVMRGTDPSESPAPTETYNLGDDPSPSPNQGVADTPPPPPGTPDDPYLSSNHRGLPDNASPPLDGPSSIEDADNSSIEKDREDAPVNTHSEKRLRKQAVYWEPEDFKAGRKRQMNALANTTELDALQASAPKGPTGQNESLLVLNLFSGPYERTDGLTAALKERGYLTQEFDNASSAGGPAHDILKDSFFQHLLTNARQKKYRAIYAAPPCSTFSVSRFNDYEGKDPLDRGPPVIRTREHVMGIPNIPPNHKNELNMANQLVARTAALIDLIAEGGGSFVIESPSDRGLESNPITYDRKFAEHAPIWLMPEILNLTYKYDAKSVTFAACRLGSRHQKYTTLLFSPDLEPNLGYLSELVCNHTRGEHERISGKNEAGKWISHQAAAYPPELCKALAAALPTAPHITLPGTGKCQGALTTAIQSTPSSMGPQGASSMSTETDGVPSDTFSLDFQGLDSHHALTTATSILALGRSISLLDSTSKSPDPPPEEEERNLLHPHLSMLSESENELYHILATKTATVRMVLDDTGSIIPQKVPRNYDDAIISTDAQEYRRAMEKEVSRHEAIPSYVLVEKPPGARVLPSIWAYDLKLDRNLRPKKWKARLCCGGHQARQGYEWFFKHSTTTSLDAFRIFIAICAYNAWTCHEDDYTTAYLNSPIDTTVYMQQPRGFTKMAPSGRPYVCLLKRAIYGLPQAGRLWQQTHTKELESQGFTQCIAEHALFKKESSDGKKMFLLINVDNVYSMGNDEEFRATQLDDIRKKFELNYLGPVEHTLGVRVCQSPKIHHITLDQEQYIHSLAEKFVQSDPERPIKKRVTPYAGGLIDLQPLREDHPEAVKWRNPCLRIAGALNWVAAFTRPDICFPLNMCMRCIVGAHEGVYDALLHILGYLVNTAEKRLAFGRDVDAPLKEHILGHTRNLRFDVFQSGDPLTFVDAGGGVKPTQCAFVYLFGGIVSARVSKLTSTVLSICEGEWSGATAAGGLTPRASWLSNPSYRLRFL